MFRYLNNFNFTFHYVLTYFLAALSIFSFPHSRTITANLMGTKSDDDSVAMPHENRYVASTIEIIKRIAEMKWNKFWFDLINLIHSVSVVDCRRSAVGWAGYFDVEAVKNAHEFEWLKWLRRFSEQRPTITRGDYINKSEWNNIKIHSRV